MIDSHTHIGGFHISNKNIFGWLQINVDDLMKYMDENGVKKCWLLSHPYLVPGYELNNNRSTLLVATSNDRIIPFCYPNKASEISGLVKQGCLGIGEVKTDKPINHPSLMKVYKEAANNGLPVLIHTTDKHCYGSLTNFKEVFHKSETNFILHGWGWWNHFNEMDMILDEFNNVFMDISANSGYLTLKNGHGFTETFLQKYSERVLFGTDFPVLTTYDGTQFGGNNHHRTLINFFDLSKNCLDNIFFKNAEKLIK